MLKADFFSKLHKLQVFFIRYLEDLYQKYDQHKSPKSTIEAYGKADTVAW